MIASKISKFDFLSIKPELNFSSKERVQTKLGGFLSLLIYIATIVGLIFFSEDFIQKKGPIVSESTLYKEDLYYEINRTNFFVKFGLFKIDSKSLGNDWESLYSVFAYQFSYKYEYNQNSQKNEIKLYPTEVNITKCTDEYMNEFYPEFKNIPYDQFYCLHPDFKFTLINRLGNVGENSYLNIYFTTCKNETALKSGVTCKPIEEIRNRISSHFVKFSISDYYLDHDDYNNPFKYYLNDQHFSGILSKYNRRNVLFKDYNYTTDVGSIFNENELNRKLLFSNYVFSSEDRNENTKFIPGTFYQYSIAYDIRGFHTKGYRKYQKIQNVLADVAGIISTLTQIFMILTKIVSKYEFLNDMIDKSSLIFTNSNEVSNSSVKIIPLETHTRHLKLKYLSKQNDMQIQNTEFTDDGRILLNRVIEHSKKLNFFKPTICMQAKISLSICNKRKDEKFKILENLNKKNISSLDVNNFLKLTNTISDLKNYLFNEKQIILFEHINKLEGLVHAEKKNEFECNDIHKICEDLGDPSDKVTKRLLSLYLSKISD